MGTSKYSNVMKSYCIDNGLLDYLRNRYKKAYKSYKSDDLSDYCELLSEIDNNSALDCSNRLLTSRYRKYSRAKKYIKKIIDANESVFITLTFTDDVIQNTNPITRRKYVARFLKEQCPYYVANIDYSPGKQREHYHGVCSNRIDMSKWSYGFVWCEVIHTKGVEDNSVARYITKLTSHAFKVNSTRLLYSRNVIE